MVSCSKRLTAMLKYGITLWRCVADTMLSTVSILAKKALMRHLTKLKRLPRFAHWNQLPSQSLQDVIDRLDKAYSKLFTDRKSGKRSGRPRFKRRKLYKSYTLKQAGWKLLQNNYIRIGKANLPIFQKSGSLRHPETLHD